MRIRAAVASLAIGAAALGVLPFVAASPAEAATYGCYKVVGVSAVNIRATAWSNAPVIAVANRGEILGKWKMFCHWRGFWCPVQKGSDKGWADKKYLQKVACPA